MSASPDDPERLCAVPSDMEAAMLVSQLNAAGIQAWTEGGPATQYRAEAPGMAYVLVPAADLERAKAIVTESRQRPSRQPATSGAPASPRSLKMIVWAIVAVVLVMLLVLGYVNL